MKKQLVFTFLFSLLFSASSYAQFDFNKIFLGGNLAYAKPTGDFSEFAKGGISYNAIAGYKITEKINAGIEYGAALTVAVDDTSSGVHIFGLSSFLAKGWYKFTEGRVKTYAGLGLGLAKFAEPDYVFTDSDGNETTIEGAKRTGFGANAELGVMFGGFNLSYSYNLNGKAPSEPVFSVSAKDVSANYHRFALGYIYNF